MHFAGKHLGLHQRQKERWGCGVVCVMLHTMCCTINQYTYLRVQHTVGAAA